MWPVTNMLKNKKQLVDIMTSTDFTQPDTLGMARDQKEAA